MQFVRARVLLVGLLGLIALTGCGLDDYEKRVLVAQKRAERFEEERLLLDEPIAIPTERDKNNNSYSIMGLFLRPPRGIQSKPSNDENPRARVFYTYPPRGEKAAAPFYDMELAIGTNNQDIRADAQRASLTPAQPTSKSLSIEPLQRSAINFELYDFDDKSTVTQMYAWRGKDKYVIVSYRFNSQQRSAAMRAIQASLGTFAPDQEAIKQRTAFEAMRLNPFKPPEHPAGP